MLQFSMTDDIEFITIETILHVGINISFKTFIQFKEFS